ncbi:MAG: Ldh family oxidoreductase [Planctomycetota bacterium]|nr:Ldh family oxidoreductase [Planctomycetota bacterium]
MPNFNADQLLSLSIQILTAAGVGAEEAEMVGIELRDANMVGHDSHGVMRLMQYADGIDQGHVKPGGEFEVIKDLPSLAIIDGHFNFGQVTATKALHLGLEKAAACATATVVIRNCNHVGRLGSYSQKAAEAGFASMMAVNAPGPGGVAVYGGIERKLGTNPITMSAPWGDKALVLDMTTSASAEGKLRVAFQKGVQVPEGWIIDAEGNPSTDPAVFYADPPGALLPLGGPLAFKGYGMSVMIDVFAGMLSGSGICRTDLPRGANGVWMQFLDIKQFLEPAEYASLMETYVANIKSSKRAPGVDEILMPGEIELRRQDERRVKGVDVPDETWRQLNELASRLGCSLKV